MLLNQFLLLASPCFSALACTACSLARTASSFSCRLRSSSTRSISTWSAFGALTDGVGGEVFALFVIAVAAAEVGIGLAIVLLMYRNRRSIDLSEADLLKG